MNEPVGDLSGPPCAFLFQGDDQLDGREEPDPLVVMLDGLDADRCGDMRLARTGAADQDEVVSDYHLSLFLDVREADG